MKPKNLQGLDFCGRHVDDNVENLVDLDELSEVRSFAVFVLQK
jgi:hypothetical protein